MKRNSGEVIRRNEQERMKGRVMNQNGKPTTYTITESSLEAIRDDIALVRAALHGESVASPLEAIAELSSTIDGAVCVASDKIDPWVWLEHETFGLDDATSGLDDLRNFFDGITVEFHAHGEGDRDRAVCNMARIVSRVLSEIAKDAERNFVDMVTARMRVMLTLANERAAAEQPTV